MPFAKIVKLVLFFSMICFLAVSVISSSYAVETTSSAKVMITGITGDKDVDILRASDDSWAKAQENMILYEGDRIRTGADSGASIKYDDGAIIDLVMESNLIITQLRDPNDSKKKLNIMSLKTGYMHGLFDTIGENEESKFEIRTPTSVCGVLGTKIYIDADTGTIYVTEGTLTIVNISTGESYTVSAGSSISISSDGSTAGAQPYSEATIETVEDTFEAMEIDVLGYTAVETDEGEVIIEFTPDVEQVASTI